MEQRGIEPLAPILRLAGTPVALNVDGLEHKRKKWKCVGRKYYLMAERLATILPTETITDAKVIQEYYLARDPAVSTMIAYGAEVETPFRSFGVSLAGRAKSLRALCLST